MGYRQHRKRFRRRLLATISQSEELSERYKQSRATRRWDRIGGWSIFALSIFGGLLGAGTIVVSGMILNGVILVGEWVGSGRSRVPAIAPLMASWCILGVGAVLANAMRLRQNVIGLQYRPWASHLPLPDERLISPFLNGLCVVAGGFLLLGLGAFGLAGYLSNWEVATSFRIGAVVILTAFTAWLLSEWLARFLVQSPMVEASCITVSLLIMLLGMVLAGFPRQAMLELRQFESYNAIWLLPPAGWYVGISGFLPDTPIHSLILPLGRYCVLWTCLASIPRDTPSGRHSSFTQCSSGCLSTRLAASLEPRHPCVTLFPHCRG